MRFLFFCLLLIPLNVRAGSYYPLTISQEIASFFYIPKDGFPLIETNLAANDTYFYLQHSLHYTGQSYSGISQVPGSDIGAIPAWNTPAPGRITVAVIDSGISLNHPDLPQNITGFDFVTYNNNLTDTNGHGTMMAGLIASTRDNYEGITGVSSKVDLAIYRITGGDENPTTCKVLEAILFGLSIDIKVFSVSIFFDPNDDCFPELSNLIHSASSQGVAFVFPAGNSGVLINNPLLPCNFPDTIGTAGSDPSKDLYSYITQSQISASNYGSFIDVAAPAFQIVVPREPQPGRISYYYQFGTSLANALVAAIVAEIRLRNPLMSIQGIIELLKSSCDYSPQLVGKVACNGVVKMDRALSTPPNAPTNLRLSYTGGKINLSWLNDSRTNEIKILRSRGAELPVEIAHLSPDVKFYIDKGSFTPGHIYKYVIKSLNAAGEDSSTVSFKIPRTLTTTKLSQTTSLDPGTISTLDELSR